MFEEKVEVQNEDTETKIEDRGLWIVGRGTAASRLLRSTIHDLRSTILIAVMIIWFAPGTSSAQQDWYYHTIHSNTLTLQYGRTAKLSYANQMSRTRQFKLSLNYITDEYDSGDDHIKSDMYNLNLEFQYNLLHFGSTFLNTHAGLGGYHLQAKNMIDQSHDETKFSFIAGLQGEYFIQKSSLAIVVDYDILYMPWSDVYEFLHLPRVGLGWTF